MLSGPLGPEWARAWICNPVITGQKWNQNKIRVNLDTHSMMEVVKTSKFTIPKVQELRHFVKGSDRYSVVDQSARGEQESLHALHSLGLYCFNTVVMGQLQPAVSAMCHARIRTAIEALEGVTQIKDDLVVVRGKWK